MNILKRKPWRCGWFPKFRWPKESDPSGILDDYEYKVVVIANQIRNLVKWFKYAHDCQDPKIGCSCAGSYRFPRVSSNVRL